MSARVIIVWGVHSEIKVGNRTSVWLSFSQNKEKIGLIKKLPMITRDCFQMVGCNFSHKTPKGSLCEKENRKTISGVKSTCRTSNFYNEFEGGKGVIGNFEKDL